MKYDGIPFPRSVVILSPLAAGAASAGGGFLFGVGLAQALGMPHPEYIGTSLAGVVSTMVTSGLAWSWMERATRRALDLRLAAEGKPDGSVLPWERVPYGSGVPGPVARPPARDLNREEGLHTYSNETPASWRTSKGKTYLTLTIPGKDRREVKLYEITATMEQVNALALAAERDDFNLAFHFWVGRRERGFPFNNQQSFTLVREDLLHCGLAEMVGQGKLRLTDHGRIAFHQRAVKLLKRGPLSPTLLGVHTM